MKLLLFFAAVLFTINVNAQTYLISFEGTGAATTVASIKVENLTAGTNLTLSGSDILRLTGLTGINVPGDKQSSELIIYPNPMTENSTLQIYPPVSGDAVISVFDITGKPVIQIQNYLEGSLQEYCISGLKMGIYVINVKGNNYQFSGKLLSNTKSNGPGSIERITTNKVANEKITDTDAKGTLATVDMQYRAGDRLKFTGSSGIYSTVKTDVPSSDKSISFNFVPCTDGDNNNYPIVQMGTQLWMSENLETTKYNDGLAIPLVTDISAWNSLTTSGYCWYGNNETLFRATYGALYNWFTVKSGNLCPIGWHVPADTEWTTLTTYLGGETVAGGRLKETGTSHWTNPNAGATNETGFTALPGGYRSYNYSFTAESLEGFWWSSTESNTVEAWYRDMNYGNIVVRRGGGIGTSKINGLSVRCLKD